MTAAVSLSLHDEAAGRRTHGNATARRRVIGQRVYIHVRRWTFAGRRRNLDMPRPSVSHDTIDDLHAYVEKNTQIPPSELSTEAMVQLVLEHAKNPPVTTTTTRKY